MCVRVPAVQGVPAVRGAGGGCGGFGDGRVFWVGGQAGVWGRGAGGDFGRGDGQLSSELGMGAE